MLTEILPALKSSGAFSLVLKQGQGLLIRPHLCLSRVRLHSRGSMEESKREGCF